MKSNFIAKPHGMTFKETLCDSHALQFTPHDIQVLSQCRWEHDWRSWLHPHTLSRKCCMIWWIHHSAGEASRASPPSKCWEVVNMTWPTDATNTTKGVPWMLSSRANTFIEHTKEIYKSLDSIYKKESRERERERDRESLLLKVTGKEGSGWSQTCCKSASPIPAIIETCKDFRCTTAELDVHGLWKSWPLHSDLIRNSIA